MAGKKYSDIYASSPVTAIANSDIFLLQRSDGNSYGIYGNNLINSSGSCLNGPYANDTVAATAGIALKTLYYDATGLVRIRLT
jgi:hypothetical protein